MKVAGTKSALESQRDALDKLEGYPKPPARVGKAIAHLVAKDLSFGRTDHICGVMKDVDVVDIVDDEGNVIDTEQDEVPGDTFVIEVPDELVAKHNGKSVRVGDRDVSLDLRPQTPRAPKPPRKRAPQASPQGRSK